MHHIGGSSAAKDIIEGAEQIALDIKRNSSLCAGIRQLPSSKLKMENRWSSTDLFTKALISIFIFILS